jgi:hypothetical protein
MRLIMGVDPGSSESAYVVWAHTHVVDQGHLPNRDLLKLIEAKGSDSLLVLEQLARMGQDIGASVLETAFWSGQFAHAARIYDRIPRMVIKRALTGRTNTKDKDVRASLLLRFGGQAKAMGTKAAPGPLYGVASHRWSALAVAVVYSDMAATKPLFPSQIPGRR